MRRETRAETIRRTIEKNNSELKGNKQIMNSNNPVLTIGHAERDVGDGEGEPRIEESRETKLRSMAIISYHRLQR